MVRALSHPQNDPVQEDDAIRDVGELIALAREILYARLVKLFYHILMHSGISRKIFAQKSRKYHNYKQHKHNKFKKKEKKKMK
jgi:hypothetical protein